MEHLIMTPLVFKEMGIHVCDDMIINTRRACNLKRRRLLDKDIQLEDPGEIMAKKAYFKAIITGDNYNPALPRTGKGDKTTEELRIVERAREVKVYLFNKGVVVNDLNAKMPLISKVNYYNGITVWFEDVIDVFPCNYNNRLSALILYLTSNVESTYFSHSFPDNSSRSCWGEPRFVDKTRALITHHLARNFVLSHQIKKYKDDYRHPLLFKPGWNARMGEMEVNFLVSDLRPDKPGTVHFTEVNYPCTAERIGLCEDLAREAAIAYNALALEGWDVVNPNETSCANCPLKCERKHESSRL